MNRIVDFILNVCVCQIGTKYQQNGAQHSDAHSQYNVRHLECLRTHFHPWVYTDGTPVSRIVVTGSITGYKVYMYSETKLINWFSKYYIL